MTGTFTPHASNPPAATTRPMATRRQRSRRLSERACGVGGSTLKSTTLVPVPPGVITDIGPVVARMGTVATISVSELTSNEAFLPWNFTTDVPVYPVPVIVTVVPAGPLEGANSAIVGGGDGVTTRSIALAPAPSASVTETGPVVAPTGTIAVICVSASTLNDGAAVSLKATPVAPLESSKPVPVIVTDVPATSLPGRNATTSGAAARAAGDTRHLRDRQRECERCAERPCTPP